MAKTAVSERIVQIPLSDLHAPAIHPFQVNDDEAMQNLIESVKQFGVREPGLARPRPEGGYELLSGNRRHRACEIAGLSLLPVIIREMSDEDAAVAMVDSNLHQREKLLFSERAWAYRIKTEALKHKGIKGESNTCDIISSEFGESKSQIFRFIRLTELIPVLLEKVDTNKLAFNCAVELSYLSHSEQTIVVEAMELNEIKPSLSQAIRLKKLKQEGKLTVEVINNMLSETKKPPKGEPTGSVRFRKYFPPDYSQKQIDVVIVRLLKAWKAQVAA